MSTAYCMIYVYLRTKKPVHFTLHVIQLILFTKEKIRVYCAVRTVSLNNSDRVLPIKSEGPNTAQCTNVVPPWNMLRSPAEHTAGTRVTSCQIHLLKPPICLWVVGTRPPLGGSKMKSAKNGTLAAFLTPCLCGINVE
jgi:hypothetical protein